MLRIHLVKVFLRGPLPPLGRTLINEPYVALRGSFPPLRRNFINDPCVSGSLNLWITASPDHCDGSVCGQGAVCGRLGNVFGGKKACARRKPSELHKLDVVGI